MPGRPSKKKAVETGLKTHRKSEITFVTLFGPIELSSKYMWQNGKSCNTCEIMKVKHQGRSNAVNAAVVDFGSEHSFDEAAVIFKRHYKFSISDSSIRRVTEASGKKAEQFIKQKLANYEEADLTKASTVAKIETLFLGFDGSSVRTGTLETIVPAENSINNTNQVKNLKTPTGRLKCKRIEEWKDVRLGFARHPKDKKKLFVGGIKDFPELMEELFKLSLGLGMNEYTKPIATSDGGNGLYEALDRQFHDLQFILDYFHFKEHLYDTAKEIGLAGDLKESFVCLKSDMAWKGQIDELLKSLEQDHEIMGVDRIRQLKGYLKRFENCINYGKFKEKEYPIGSGEIESAHKHITQKRLKLAGACWKRENVNPMLALRLIKANDWWDEFWDNNFKKLAA